MTTNMVIYIIGMGILGVVLLQTGQVVHGFIGGAIMGHIIVLGIIKSTT